MHSSSTLSFQRNFDAIRRAYEPVAQFRDRTALLDALHRSRDGPDRKNRILRVLVGAAQGDGAAADCVLTLLLLAFWPGLDAIRRRSIWRRIGTADEIASDVLARTTEAIRCLHLDRVNRIAATILRNVERDMIRARQRELERERAGSDMDPDDLPAEMGAQYQAADGALMQDDLRSLVSADAALVSRVAIEGLSQAEAALELGLSEAATRKRYQRATRRLRDLLQETA